MTIDFANARALLKSFELKKLFIEELGWDKLEGLLSLTINETVYRLNPVAQKRGFVVYEHQSETFESIPDSNTRKAIDRALAKLHHEHILVFTDKSKTIQRWQWVRREHTKPLAYRDDTFHKGESGERLIQKLNQIAFSIDEEETASLVDTSGKVRAAFDVDKITKRFYDYFKTEHDKFLSFINGIPDEQHNRWYASVMLNRLMFIYFIQKKGFLNGDDDYLKNKLAESKKRGKDGYYKSFLCRLFFEGFACKAEARSKDLNLLLGEIPFLNGGLFLPHQIEEQYGKDIDIADAAFERLFTFFDGYQWHLDDRPLRNDREINPDVLGYIFEKYINQKQMGAYYTKEDITEYISKNTVLPFILDKAKEKCAVAFEGEHSLWNLLSDNPDRYIYEPVRRGVVYDSGEVAPESVLPDFVQTGMYDPKARMFEKRYNLGDAELLDDAGNKLTLPTETWREYVERRKRCLELREKLANGEIHEVNDLITYNLNIRQFMQDVIDNCEGSNLLVSLWKAITGVTILDPTCGSGAFLFAALNILEPLYEACLERMQSFLDEWGEEGRKLHRNYHKQFTNVLAKIDEHPSRKYFVFKSIIINNLYGVDIMDEAIEICKLRLFLKLVAQVDDAEHIEPLPDIDFNIRAGNTLVGFANEADVKRAVDKNLIASQTGVLENIKKKAEGVSELFMMFREQQTEHGGEVTHENKEELQSRLKNLSDELDIYLASEYGIGESQSDKQGYRKRFDAWKQSHKPFHWWSEFYEIINRGGFDVIIGNPPYLELPEIDYQLMGYDCLPGKAVHAICMERSTDLLNNKGCMSMIVPLSIVSTQRMFTITKILEKDRGVWYSNFSWRPAKLFDTVNRALTIFVLNSFYTDRVFSTSYRKWTSDSRELVIPTIQYSEVSFARNLFWIPKIESSIEKQIICKFIETTSVLGQSFSKGVNRVYYRKDGGLYWKVFTSFAPYFKSNGVSGSSSREIWFSLRSKEYVMSTIAILSSDFFWWWYTVSSNCRHVNPYDLQNYPVPIEALASFSLHKLGEEFIDDLVANSTSLIRNQKQTGTTETQCFNIHKSKHIIDQIDVVLAEHYGFTDEELDFIINYDIKYRMGRNTGGGGSGDGDDESSEEDDE